MNTLGTTNGTTNGLIEITARGPSIAGTRITVYSVMDSIKAGWDKEEIFAHLPRVSRAQLDAVYDYIEQHREEIEAEYARILQREALAQAESERIFRERSPFPPEMPAAEKRRLMVEKAKELNQASLTRNGNHPLA